MDKNTQQPVAWLFQHEDTGLTECVDAQQVEWGFEKNNPRWQKIYPLYHTPPAPPVPRDVLMAALTEINSRYMEVCGAQFGGEYISAIADRYASQVQSERNTVTLEEMVAKLKAGENGDAISKAMTQATADMALGRAVREGYATQPEPVNQQMLARWLAFGKAMQKAGSDLPRHLIADTEAAIAAAMQK